MLLYEKFFLHSCTQYVYHISSYSYRTGPSRYIGFFRIMGIEYNKIVGYAHYAGCCRHILFVVNSCRVASIGKEYTQIFAFIAALSISMMTAFNLGAKSNNTRNAWRKLNAAIMKFNQNIVDKEAVIRAYEEGESLIGGVSFSQGGIQYDELSKKEDKTEEKNPTQPTTKTGGSPTIK